jgi:uncharacterized protein YqeY
VTLKERLNADLRDAMRANDDVRKMTLRLLLTGVHNAEIPPEQKNVDAAASAPQRLELSDDDVLNVIRREVKQRRDSIDAYTKANRPDLAAKEEAELAILLVYLPAQMSKEEIEAVAREVIKRVGATGPADKGRVMPVLMNELRGKADGAQINAAVTQLLGALT